MDRRRARRPANRGPPWRVRTRISKEAIRGRLAVVARAREDLGHPGGAVREFDRHPGADAGRIARGAAEPDARGSCLPGYAAVAEGEGRVVVAASTMKSGPSVLVEVEDGEGLGVAGHDQAALGRGHGREMPAAVAAQELAQAAVEAPDRWGWARRSSARRRCRRGRRRRSPRRPGPGRARSARCAAAARSGRCRRAGSGRRRFGAPSPRSAGPRRASPRRGSRRAWPARRSRCAGSASGPRG